MNGTDARTLDLALLAVKAAGEGINHEQSFSLMLFLQGAGGLSVGEAQASLPALKAAMKAAAPQR